MGLKKIQKSEDLPACSPVQVDLSAGLDIIFENLGDNVIIFENLGG